VAEKQFPPERSVPGGIPLHCYCVIHFFRLWGAWSHNCERICMRQATLLLFLGLAAVAMPGCCLVSQLGPWGGPAYDLDYDKIGTGEQAITPTNDPWYMNGEPQDCRTNQ